jgi:hypothetical protein
MTYFERVARNVLDKPLDDKPEAKPDKQARPQPSLPKLKFMERPMPSDVLPTTRTTAARRLGKTGRK